MRYAASDNPGGIDAGCRLAAVRRRRPPLLGLVGRQRKIDAKPTVTANVSIRNTTATVSDWR
jgi:hypothetical protein